MNTDVPDSTVLIVDDEPQVLNYLGQIMAREGYRVLTSPDGAAAIELVKKDPPDLVILDINMPGLSGAQVCARLKSDAGTRFLPVVMHTGLEGMFNRLMAREFDADDFFIKGSSPEELRARVRSLLRLKHRTDELESASAVLATMARIVEKRDFATHHHCWAVAVVCEQICGRLGLSGEVVARLRLGATFQDIGMIVIEDAILLKQGPLTEAERAKMMTHAEVGAELIEPMHTLRPIRQLVRNHHEKLDGSGYPDRLKGDQISVEVRVLAVADIYQALISLRPYKPAFSQERAVEILREEAAKGWWDGKVVEVLAGLVFEGAMAKWT